MELVDFQKEAIQKAKEELASPGIDLVIDSLGNFRYANGQNISPFDVLVQYGKMRRSMLAAKDILTFPLPAPASKVGKP
jgi:hypothetical protein